MAKAGAVKARARARVVKGRSLFGYCRNSDGADVQGLAVNAAAIAGSDDANGDSGHDSDEGWEGQRTAAEEGGGRRTGLRARLHWELQGTLGGGECLSGFLANPLPCFYRANMGSRMVLSAPFCWSSEIGPFGLPVVPKKI